MSASHDNLLKLIRQALIDGEDLDLGHGAAISDDEMWTWGEDRTITSTELTKLILDKSFEHHPRGLRIRGLRVVGVNLQLSYQTLDSCLFFYSCLFECPVELIQAKLNLLIFRGCLINAVIADRLECPLVLFDRESPGRGIGSPNTGIERPTRISGFVRMKNASISHLSFLGAEFDATLRPLPTGTPPPDKKKIDLNLEGSVIEDFLDLEEMTTRNLVDLSRVKCGELRLGHLEGGTAPYSTIRRTGLRDLQYAELTGDPRSDVSAGLRWLRTQDESVADNFSFEPYTTLANYYAKVGDDSFARHTRITSAKMRARRASPPIALLRLLYGAFAGYGYRPRNSILALVGLVALTFLLVQTNSTSFTLTQPTLTVRVFGQLPSAPGTSGVAVASAPLASQHVSASRALEAAVDNDLPVLNLAAAPPAQITAVAPAWLRAALIVCKLLGYLLLTIALAGLTGLLKKV